MDFIYQAQGNYIGQSLTGLGRGSTAILNMHTFASVQLSVSRS